METDLPDKPKMGRPTHFSEEVINQIFDRMASGEPLTTICKDPSLPGYRTVARWLRQEKHKDLWHAYARTREIQVDYLATDTLAIADEAEDFSQLEDPRFANAYVQAKKLQIQTRQWYAGKMHPQVWGDRSQVDVNALVSVLAPEDVHKGRNAGLGVTQTKLAEKSGVDKVVDVPDSRAGRGKLS